MSEGQCFESSEIIHLFIDGEVRGIKRWKVQRHLRRCGACGDVVGFETRLRTIVRERCAGEPCPEGLEERIRQFLAEACDEPSD